MAKIATTALLLFSNAILLLTILPCREAQRTAVVDVDGKQVRLENPYVITLAGSNSGGHLTLKSINGGCPKYVTEAKLGFFTLPALFHHSADARILQVGMRVNVQFPTAPYCDGLSTYWYSSLNSGARNASVVRGGKRGGEFTNSWFYFRPGSSEGAYRIDFCPCLRCRIACFPVGLGSDKRLVLNGSPLEVSFSEWIR